MVAMSEQMLLVADTVAREKNIEREEVIEAMEMAIAKAARAKYGQEYDIRAHIDRGTGDVDLKRYVEIVADEDEESFETEMRQLRFSEAQKQHPDLKVGEFITEDLPPIEYGRITAQSARQVIQQKVREAEKRREFEEYGDKEGQIVNGTVKRVEYGNVTLDLGRAEGFIRRDESIPRENLRPGDRVRAYIYEVRSDGAGPQIMCSRTHPQFLAKLFAQEVQEVYDGTIEIKAVARDPGSRAKIAVFSHDPTVDPRGACIGMRGSRVQAVKAEIQEENIDVILWSPDTARFVVDALYPAEIQKVVLDEEDKRIEVVVGEDDLSLAIGRRGQNVRLAAKLLGWEIDVVTEEQEAERTKREIEERSELFIAYLDVDEVIARLLATEGFAALEEVAYVPIEELMEIQGFDGDIATEIQNRALQAVEKQRQEQEGKLSKLKVEDALLQAEGMTNELALILAEQKVTKLDDFADLATDELMEMLEEAGAQKMLDKATAESMIMAARAHWFDDEPAEATSETTSEATSGDDPEVSSTEISETTKEPAKKEA